MIKKEQKKKNKKIKPEIKSKEIFFIDKLFKGIEGFIRLVERVEKAGGEIKEVRKIEDKNGEIRGIVGYSIKTDIGKKPEIDKKRNLK